MSELKSVLTYPEDFPDELKAVCDTSLAAGGYQHMSIKAATCRNNSRFGDLTLVGFVNSLKKADVALSSLTLTHHHITAVGLVENSSYISCLSHIDLEGNDVAESTQFIESLKLESKNCPIQYLNLSSNPMGILAGMKIADVLLKNKSLHTLYLNNCGLDLTCQIAILTSISQNKNCKLNILEIDRPILGNPNKREEVVDHISRLIMLSSSSALCHLSLRHHNMQDFGCSLLADALGRYKGRITYLNLESNKIGVSGTTALAQMLVLQEKSGAERYSCIRTLKLSYNFIGDEGAAALADALLHNKSLTELTIKNNSIHSKGLVMIGTALESNNTLERLSLYGNDFDQDSGRLFHSLAKNRFDFIGLKIDIQMYIVDGEYQVAEVAI